MTTATHSRAARRNFFRRALSGAALAVLATASTMETADAQGSYVSRSQRACIVYICRRTAALVFMHAKLQPRLAKRKGKVPPLDQSLG